MYLGQNLQAVALNAWDFMRNGATVMKPELKSTQYDTRSKPTAQASSIRFQALKGMFSFLRLIPMADKFAQLQKSRSNIPNFKELCSFQTSTLT